MSRFNARAAFVVALLAVPGLAACSSDKEETAATTAVAETAAPAETSAETAAPAETEAAAETAAPAETEAVAETSAPAETTEPVTEAVAGANPDSDYCKAVKSTGKTLSGLNTINPTNFGEIVTVFGTAEAQIATVAEVAPDSLKADWTLLGKTLGDLSKALEPFKDVDVNDPSSIDPAKLAEFQAVGEKFTNFGTDFAAITKRIDDGTKAECGFTVEESTK